MKGRGGAGVVSPRQALDRTGDSRAYLYSPVLGYVAIQSRKVARVRENPYQGDSRRVETKHVTG